MEKVPLSTVGISSDGYCTCLVSGAGIGGQVGYGSTLKSNQNLTSLGTSWCNLADAPERLGAFL